MIKNLQKKKEEGFTIIEVLIVLAIAGLIILIVFLAVPALKRNSRNTAIKSDVQNVLGGIAEFQANNNGATPTSIAGTGDVIISKLPLTQTTKIQGSTDVNSGAAAPGAGIPAVGSIYVAIGIKCDNTASSRAVSAYYNIETSGASSRQCIDS